MENGIKRSENLRKSCVLSNLMFPLIDQLGIVSFEEELIESVIFGKEEIFDFSFKKWEK